MTTDAIRNALLIIIAVWIAFACIQLEAIATSLKVLSGR